MKIGISLDPGAVRRLRLGAPFALAATGAVVGWVSVDEKPHRCYDAAYCEQAIDFVLRERLSELEGVEAGDGW